jgi:hypothetical protein
VVSKIPYSVFRIEQFSGIAHTLMAPRFGGLQILELKDRIAELCNRATTEKDPAALNSVLSELKAALSEYIRAARRMTILHFDYFQKHQNLSPQVLPRYGAKEQVANTMLPVFLAAPGPEEPERVV